MRKAALAMLAVLAVLVLLTMEGVAAARDPVAAEALFRSAREALKRGDWATACARFTASQELDPAAGTALNIAVCEEKQGHVASAWRRLREAIDLLPPGDDRVPSAQKHAAELEQRVPHLTVRLAPGAPPGTRVRRDDVEVGGALLGFAQPLDPGPHVVHVWAPGRAERTYPIVSTEGVTEEILGEPGAPLPRVTVDPHVARRTTGYVVGGVGVAATALGIVTGLTVIARGDERQRLCPGDVCPTPQALDEARGVDSLGKTISAISTVAFAVGGVGLAVGTYLMLTSPSKETAVALSPSVSRDAASLSIGGRF
jgi:hypothetical protein